MIRSSLLTVFIVCTTFSLFSQTTRVLFIGNSYTYVNDLPGTFSQLSLSLGDTVTTDMSAPGGYTFQLHTTNATTLSKIQQTGWNYVVLQAQSQEPSFPPAQVASDTYPYAGMLDSLVHVANPCALSMFYMTWGRKYGDAANCPFYPPLCTFSGMNNRLRQSYLEMGLQNAARVAPAGVAWANSRNADSTINLWSGDNSHPSPEGTYLTACVFYASVFKQSPVGATYTAGLSAPVATFLQTIAASTVLDSINTWFLNQNPVVANFTSIVNGADASFTSTSIHADSLMWDFGDGNTSNANNPNHTYTSTGNYIVTLVAYHPCYSDTVTQTIQINSLAMEQPATATSVNIYPNPASQSLQMNYMGPYQILSCQGQVIKNGISSLGQPIDVSQLATGMYIIQTDTKRLTFIKQ